MSDWNTDQYLRFKAQRTQRAIDLARRLEEIPGPDNGKKTGPARLTVTVKLGGKGKEEKQ